MNKICMHATERSTYKAEVDFIMLILTTSSGLIFFIITLNPLSAKNNFITVRSPTSLLNKLSSSQSAVTRVIYLLQLVPFVHLQTLISPAVYFNISASKPLAINFISVRVSV